MAFPTVAGTVAQSRTSSTGTSHTISFDTTPSSGDGLLVVCSFGADTTTTFPSANGTWTKLVDQVNSSLRVVVAFKTANGEGSSITVTGGSSARAAFLACRFSAGSFTGSPEVHTSSATSTGVTSGGTGSVASTDSPNPPNITPSWGTDDVAWVAIGCQRANSTVSTWPTNHTSNQTEYTSTGSGANIAMAALAIRNLNASSLNPAAYSLASGGGSSSNGITVAVRGVTATIPNKQISANFSVTRASFY